MFLKKFFTLISSGIICMLFFYGCAGTVVQQTLYLGDTDVNAPITPPPTHVSIDKKSGDITVSPKIYINTTKNLSGISKNSYKDNIPLKDNSVFVPRSKNLVWKYPSLVAGLDFDAALSNHLAMFGGFSLSNDENDELVGGNIGIGFFSQKDNIAIRFDAGLGFQQYFYDAVTILKTRTTTWGSSTEETTAFRDRGKVFNANPFFSFTINSAKDSTALNYFLSTGYFTQNLLNFNPGETDFYTDIFGVTHITTDLRPDCTLGFGFINPGISYRFDKNLNILFSVKIMKEILSLSSSNDWFFCPSLQFDWGL